MAETPRSLVPVPPDVRAAIVEAFAQALAADWRRRHAAAETADQAKGQDDDRLRARDGAEPDMIRAR